MIGPFFIYFAPKKGSELTRDAKNKIDEIKENPKDVLQGTFDDVKEKINEFIINETILMEFDVSQLKKKIQKCLKIL